MTNKIKSALEIALEKVNKIDKLTPEEREKIREHEKIKSLLAKFYKGRLTSNSLWKKLKGNSHFVLKDAQIMLTNSLSLKNSSHDFSLRKDGILAIETLKKDQNISLIESLLNDINLLQKKYTKIIENMANNLKAEIKKNPQSRIKTIKQGEKIIVVHLSEEEALNENPQWKKFLSENEEEYKQKFGKILEKLKEAIR
jgi:hypothetical protein